MDMTNPRGHVDFGPVDWASATWTFYSTINRASAYCQSDINMFLIFDDFASSAVYSTSTL